MAKKDTKLVQIAVPSLQFKKLKLLKNSGLIRSYAHLVRIAFEMELEKKWNEFQKAYPEKAKEFYLKLDDSLPIASDNSKSESIT